MPEAIPNPVVNDGAAVVAQLRPALIAYFQRRCGNAAEAEDLAQDVILRALSHTRWTSAEHARSYIFTIALNCWRDRGRRRLSRTSVIDWNEDLVQGVAEESSPERVLSNQQQLASIVAALGELAERTRDIFVLCRLENMKHSQIAELLGISVSAVEKHLSKALAHLARRMDHDDGIRRP
ncbi:MAG TPA: sigma-70 family RNA polymerase sigma factor [Steroidobacteraceae bacterium]|jgi:RNA polymerase sigma-70 factor (ECF subfamily)|nr:sigma-70 family RNA polymerase sigma factor [Steroidobacteraceae bacterium]